MKDPGAMLNQKQNSMNAAPGSSHLIKPKQFDNH
jgi:hypothetical protein